MKPAKTRRLPSRIDWSKTVHATEVLGSVPYRDEFDDLPWRSYNAAAISGGILHGTDCVVMYAGTLYRRRFSSKDALHSDGRKTGFGIELFYSHLVNAQLDLSQMQWIKVENLPADMWHKLVPALTVKTPGFKREFHYDRGEDEVTLSVEFSPHEHQFRKSSVLPFIQRRKTEYTVSQIEGMRFAQLSNWIDDKLLPPEMQEVQALIHATPVASTLLF